MQFKVLYKNIQWNKNVLVVSPDVPHFIHLSVGSFADKGNKGGSNKIVLELPRKWMSVKCEVKRGPNRLVSEDKSTWWILEPHSTGASLFLSLVSNDDTDTNFLCSAPKINRLNVLSHAVMLYNKSREKNRVKNKQCK